MGAGDLISSSVPLSLSENHGHQDDTLCVAQYPPLLLVTSSYDGEMIMWKVLSGRMYCELGPPSPLMVQKVET